MSDAEHSIKRFELARLIGGDDAAARVVDRRLREYEADGIVKPEVRHEPLPPIPAYFVMRSRARADPKAQLDAWYEALKSEGLPPLHRVPEPAMHKEYYYSSDDAKLVAQHVRKIAPLRTEFCRFAWDSEVDPAAVVVPVEVPQESDDAANERPYVSKQTAIELLKPHCPTIASILKNAGHKDYAWLAPARRAKGLKGWYLDTLVGLLIDKGLAEPDAIAKLKEEADSRAVTLTQALRTMSRTR